MTSHDDQPRIHASDIAIIGMDCIFPSAPDLNTFWQNIVSKVDAITDVPLDRWDPEIFFDPDSTANDRVYCKRGGYLKDVTQFNPLDYGIMPVAVEGGDPNQFLALKVAYRALANAGYSDHLKNKEKVEIILGRGNYLDRGNSNIAQHSRVIEQTLQILKNLHPLYTAEELQAIKVELKANLPNFGPDNAASIIPNITTGRIANRLDLMGTNFTVDAACASSLIAAEIAIHDLRTRKCDLALVGGIFIIPDVQFPIIFCQLKALSRQSQIRPFDKNADGTLLGEGVGVLVLKRLEDAERDSDNIYAVIKSVGTSSDGRGFSVTAPRVEGVELALRHAYEMSGVSPQTIELIEGHGTGTPVGDAVEIEALTRVFGNRGKSNPWCALGTIKSMIGHAMPAAGAAGIIKAALALHHKVLPPTLHCDEPHPKLENTPFYINSETRPWIHGAKDRPRRAAINAFGFGGVNAHMVLEEYRHADEAKTTNCLTHWESEAFILHAESRQSLIEQAQQLEKYLETNPSVSLKDLAYTLNTAPNEVPYCLALVAFSHDDLQQKLLYAIKRLSEQQCTQIKDIKGIYFFEKPISREGKLAFLFPGEGSQYVGMLADLCIHFPEVRACFDELDLSFIDYQRDYLPSQLIFPSPALSKMERSQADNRLWQMEGAIVAVFTANKALWKLLTNMGLKPDAVVGHSTGDFSAMFASGMTEMNPQRLQKLSTIYPNLIEEDAIPEAIMVAVGTNYALASAIVGEIEGNIYIAMDNCPHQVVVVGEQDAMEKAIDGFQRKGLIYEKLPFNRAYHTPLFGGVCKYFRQFFLEQPISPPKIETWSCTTMQPYSGDITEMQELAINHWVNTVRFRETIEAMHTAGIFTFVEVGPRGNLTAFVDDILRGKPHLAIASNVPRRSGITQLNHLVAMLAAQRFPMSLDYLYLRRAPRLLSLYATQASDVKDTAGSMMLSLGFPTTNVSPRKPPADRTEIGPLPSETDVKSQQDTLSAQSPLTPQKPGAMPVLEASQVFEEGIPIEGGTQDFSLQTMTNFFETMEHFLDVQQNVVQAFLRRPAAGNHDEKLADEAIASETRPMGYAEASPVSPAPETGIEQAAEVVGRAPESITAIVLKLVGESTGYPPEVLDLNQDMAIDLGIDLTKRTEIMAAVQEQYPSLQNEVDTKQLASLKTLQQVIDYLTEKLTATETEPVPLIDRRPAGSGIETSIPETHLQHGVSNVVTEAADYPLIGTTLSYMPGQELVALRQVDLKEDIFLLDHALGSEISVTDKTLKPLSVIPMTVSMEMMAEAAAKVMSHKILIGMKDIRAHRWILVDEEKPTTLRIVARKKASLPKEEVAVSIWNVEGSAKPSSNQGSPVAEGIMVFGGADPAAPTIGGNFSLRSERLPKHTAEEVYRGKIMFHGPLFRGVVLLDRVGEDGVIGQVQVLPNKGLFKSNANPSFITDPFLIDAMGQLIGYWPQEYLETKFVAFPVSLAALHLYGPKPNPAERFTCHVSIRQVTSVRISADIDVIDLDGKVRMRLIGWEDWRFYWTPELSNFSRNPRGVALSVRWDTPISKFPVPESFECYQLNILGPEQTALRDLWVYTILNRRERQTWRNLRGTEAHRDKWLAGQLVAKDAIRMYLKKHHALELCPADIEIATDKQGAPVAQGMWTNQVEMVPVVSLAHTEGLAVAVAGYCNDSRRIGIDVERISNNNPRFERLVFTPEEQSLMLSVEEPFRQEWIARFWCAKEAVAKGLTCGMVYGPQSLTVQEINMQTGVIHVSLRGKVAEMFPDLANFLIVAYTAREGSYIVSSTLCERA